MENCIFCKISRGEIGADIVYEDDYTVAFRDINPKAPVHILVIPRQHFAGIHEIPSDRLVIAEQIFNTINQVVKKEDLKNNGGYRLVINFGSNSGQEVPHIHVHILSGKRMPHL